MLFGKFYIFEPYLRLLLSNLALNIQNLMANSAPHNWTSTRQSILVVVFLVYFINFTIQWLARKSKDENITDRIRALRFKVFVFGLLSLFACNLVHTGIFVAVIAWLLFFTFTALHYLYFKEFDNKIRSIVNLVLHGLFTIYIVANVTSFVTQDNT